MPGGLPTDLYKLNMQPTPSKTFGSVRLTEDVWAVPEARIVFADEPILEVSAPVAEAQLVETYLLKQITLQTTLATKAARCRGPASFGQHSFSTGCLPPCDDRSFDSFAAGGVTETMET